MKIAIWLANFSVSSVLLLVGLYFVISLCVAFFKLSGQITEGQQMLFDMQTPTWAGLLTFQGTSAAILGIALVLRRRLRDLASNLDLGKKSRTAVSGGILVGIGFLVAAAFIVTGHIDFSGPCAGSRQWVCEFFQHLHALGGAYAVASIYLSLGLWVLYGVSSALMRGDRIER